MSRIIVYETQIGGHRKRTSSRLDIITDTIGSIVIQMKRRYGEITYRNAYAFLYVAAAGRQFDTLPDTTVIACKYFRSRVNGDIVALAQKTQTVSMVEMVVGDKNPVNTVESDTYGLQAIPDGPCAYTGIDQDCGIARCYIITIASASAGKTAKFHLIVSLCVG